MKSRAGFAVPAAMMALTIVSLFIAGSSFLSLQSARASRAAITERLALEAAEYGATALMRDWDIGTNASLPPGGTIGPWQYHLAGDATATVRITRATPLLLWAISEGRAGAENPRRAARRVVRGLYRFDLPDVELRAALTARDSVRVLAGGLITGTDTTSGGGTAVCTASSEPVAGVASPDTSKVCDEMCGGGGSRITGIPPVRGDPALAESHRYNTISPGTWATLASRAQIVIANDTVITPGPRVAGSACDLASSGNWGDPASTGPCASYFPIIWARGDIEVAGGVGQGVLLSDGDVTFSGGASFSGVVMARDDFVTQGAGGAVFGAVFAGDARSAPGDVTRVGDGGLIRFSGCAATRALLASAPVMRIRKRYWAELF